jgi:hypothetical protein
MTERSEGLGKSLSGAARSRFGAPEARSQDGGPRRRRALAEGQRAARNAIPEWDRETPQQLWPKANAPLIPLVGRGEGLETDGGLPAGS